MAPFVLAFLPDAPYTLALDRTQWMLARVPINFLVLSAVHGGIAFPLFWQFLAKRGNSNTQERIELLGQFLKVLGSDKIDCLVADREFIGAEWFAWLRANHIPFCIRIRHDMKVSRTTGALSPARNFFRKPSPFDLVFLDRPASRVRSLALAERYALALRGLLDRGVESSGSSSPGGV
jgi:hypothetical protein